MAEAISLHKKWKLLRRFRRNLIEVLLISELWGICVLDVDLKEINYELT
jgi:hypothetical protein